MQMKVLDLGRMAYEPCVEIQRSCAEEVATGNCPNTLVLVEHDPVITLGASFHEENLLLTAEEFGRRGIQIFRTDRGGDVTYHAPGQLVIYPIFSLVDLGKDLHKWLRALEETMIVTLAAFGLKGRRFPPHTGAWVDDRKIAALGIKVRKWTSMHGIALNCDNDLTPFSTIVPCGIRDYGVTSLSQELGRAVPVSEVKPIVLEAFQRVF